MNNVMLEIPLGGGGGGLYFITNFVIIFHPVKICTLAQLYSRLL
jgi:hypothetical protein